jgi:general secretion pathway protein F
MPRYVFNGIAANGRRETGELEGPDEGAIYAILSGLGVTATDLRPVGDDGTATPWYAREIALGGQGTRAAAEAELAELLAILFRARMSLPEVVRIATSSTRDPGLRAAFGRIGQRIADGATLADSTDGTLAGLSPHMRAMLRLVDKSFDPSDALQVFAQYMRQRDMRRRKLKGALIYPAILVAAAVGVMVIVALVLVPAIEPIFAGLNRPLPAGLSVFKAVGQIVSDPVALAALGLLSLFGSLIALRPPAPLRRVLSDLAGRLPFLGRATFVAELARLTHLTNLLLRSGLDLAASLRESVAIDGTGGASAVFRAAADALDQGRPASSALVENKRVPPVFLSLFTAAEATNSFENVLPALAAALDQEVDQRAERNVALLTPLLTLVLGGGIGLLIYTVMDAVLSVNDLAL